MNIYFTASVVALLHLITLPAIAEQEKTAMVPEKVVASILKRHPNAQDLQANYESHFGVKLLEVGFKTESGEKELELFTLNGHLFTNELQIENLSELSPSALAALRQQFPGYQLKKAELVTNPNGVGEEYEIYLHAGGSDWKVSIDDKGNIAQKENVH